MGYNFVESDQAREYMTVVTEPVDIYEGSFDAPWARLLVFNGRYLTKGMFPCLFMNHQGWWYVSRPGGRSDDPTTDLVGPFQTLEEAYATSFLINP